MKNYWIPSKKYQLEAWLAQRFPADAKAFKRMSKSKLYAIYFSTRDKIVRGVLNREPESRFDNPELLKIERAVQL